MDLYLLWKCNADRKEKEMELKLLCDRGVEGRVIVLRNKIFRNTR